MIESQEEMLSTDEMKSAVDQLMMARSDAVFLVAGDGTIVSESPAAALFRATLPSFGLLFAELAAAPPRRAAFHPRADLGVGLFVAPCAQAPGASIMVTVSKLGANRRRPLTLRQRQLLALLRAGLRNAEIAERMDIAASTVKTMLERLYRLAGVANRQALVHWATMNQLS